MKVLANVVKRGRVNDMASDRRVVPAKTTHLGRFGRSPGRERHVDSVGHRVLEAQPTVERRTSLEDHQGLSAAVGPGRDLAHQG